MEAEEGTNEERNGFGRRKEEKQRSVKITKEKTPRRRMFFLSIARFVLSQARRGFLLHFFVWADEIVAYLSQSSAAGFVAVRIFSTHRFKGVRIGWRDGKFYSNRHVTAH